MEADSNSQRSAPRSGSRPVPTRRAALARRPRVVNLAAYLALSGTSTLVIDLDPQGNATSGLGVDRRSLDRSVYDALINRVPIGELVVGTAIPGLDLVPAALALSGAEVELVGLPARERRLSASLADLGERYDRVLIDCPPSLGLLTVNALTAADGVLIPIQTEYYALEGLSQLVNTIRMVREGTEPTPGDRRRAADDVRRPHPPLGAGRRRGAPPPGGGRVRDGRAAQHPPRPRPRATGCRSPSTTRPPGARRPTDGSPPR